MTNPASASASSAAAADHIRALRALPEMGDYTLAGEEWTRFRSLKEYKVSPHGGEGDFDTDCYYVADSDLEATVMEIVG